MRARAQAGIGAVPLLVLLSLALGAVWALGALGESASRTLCEQSASVAAIGAETGVESACGSGRPSSRALGAEIGLPSAPAGAETVGWGELGLAFGASAGSTLYSRVQALSNLVNPLSDGFLGRRINSAGAALLNLAINPEQQIAREVAVVRHLWGSLKRLAGDAASTALHGSARSRAELAGELAGLMLAPPPQVALAATAPVAALIARAPLRRVPARGLQTASKAQRKADRRRRRMMDRISRRAWDRLSALSRSPQGIALRRRLTEQDQPVGIVPRLKRPRNFITIKQIRGGVPLVGDTGVRMVGKARVVFDRKGFALAYRPQKYMQWQRRPLTPGEARRLGLTPGTIREAFEKRAGLRGLQTERYAPMRAFVQPAGPPP